MLSYIHKPPLDQYYCYELILILSGQTAGIRYIKDNKGCLIVNLPGKSEAINDCLQIIFKSIPKCLNIIHANEMFLN